MRLATFVRSILLAPAILLSLSSDVPAQPPPASAPVNELDAFMEKVLARRAVNRRTMDEYVLDEVERFHILGPGRMPLHRTRREYTWYVRDGMHVRSPVRFNGAAVGEDARQRYEVGWMARERARRERREEADATGSREPAGERAQGHAAAAVEPRFVSEAYFLEFRFEPGNYYLAGRERLDGHDVLRVEYIRGYRVDAFDGDRMVIGSAELRLPITSVLNGARFGVTAFFDAGNV